MLKYIKTADGDFVLFGRDRMHSCVAKRLRVDPISAGFVHPAAGGLLCCVGASESLGLESLPEDTEQLREWLS